ncbi:regulation of mast cell degranulation [Branchiostoma belcheri]|nr:regulation of mast cell degranulation [Branchiostoma belcheri]
MAGDHIWFVLIWMCLGLVGVSSKLLLVKTPVNPEVNQTVSLNCSGVFGSTMVKRLCPGQALPYYTKVEDGYGRMYYFPPSADSDRAGIYRCQNFEGERVSIDTSIFPPNARIFSPFFSMTAHVRDDVTLTMAVREDSDLPTANVSWRLYQPGPNCAGALLPENQDVVIRQNVTSRKDGGMYEMSVSDVRQGTQRAVVQLLVTDCPERLWGPDCSQPCPPCENGGMCGEDGRCVCPPGFTGDVCQIGCGPNTYGYDCESTCGGNCTDMLFCLLPPYGCSCGAGLRGTDCHQECATGTYGAGCSQTCGHCQDGVTCDPHTGTCPQERCEPGWQGNTCKQQITHEGDSSSAYLIVLGVAACTLVLVGSPLWFYLRTTSKCAPKISGPDFDMSTVRGISDLAQTRSPYTVESFIKDDLHITAKSKFSDWEISRAILNIDTKAIGSGAFGKVYKARVTENTGSTRLPGVVAIKRLKDNATSQQKADFLEEIEHMVEVGSHPNILKLYGCCTLEQPIYMVVEYMQHGDLLGFLRRCKQQFHFSKNDVDSCKFDEKNMYQVARQVARGMEYLAGLKFIHGDLAARNILVGDGLSVKISDFGLSSDIYRRGYYREDPWRKVPVKWAAPERLMEGMRCSIKADVWSFGIVLYEVATLGEDPYPDIPNSTAALVSRLSTGYRMAQPRGCSNRLYDLMCRCWEWEPGCRPSFTELFNDCDQALQDKSDYKDVAGIKVSINSDDIDDASDSAEEKDQDLDPDADDVQTSPKGRPGSYRKWSYVSLAWETDDLFTVSG